ncbi:hypothetical protein ONZ51_g3390 [Trametes cubensis]|uniref:Uncharacterized protein n=1 Tax=Trametes cubensis TaxID=1111947 RepID=A0AAD7U0A2_9APHY|nr:hypothetical protein ONZ51_g3390 [Trametes cubensis]
MAPLSFTKLFSQRSSSASTTSSQARSSFDAFEPESYVIALVSQHSLLTHVHMLTYLGAAFHTLHVKFIDPYIFRKQQWQRARRGGVVG